MTIGINGNEANVEHRVGVGQYAYELISNLKVQSTKHHFNTLVYLNSQPRQDMPAPAKYWNYQVFGPQRLWTLTALQKKLIDQKRSGVLPDIFFTPTHYTPLYMPTPSVISIMDLSVERFPEFFKRKDYFQLKYWTQASVLIAKKIITISEHSKKELCNLYAVSPDKVVVTYPGYDSKRFKPVAKNKRSRLVGKLNKYKIEDQKYFLFLGTLQPRKNLTRLIEAFATLGNNNLKLVIVGMNTEGRGGWMQQPIFDKVNQLGLSKKVIFTGFIPDADVPILMAGSKAFVLPSLYEGFGIPPIEAMATGVPVVVSKVSSLPEICGLAATYIDNPYEVGSIQQALQEVLLQTPSQRARKVRLGMEWVKRYNWDNTAKKTLQVLYDAAQR
ncbi:hypothetical protein A2721_01925 [Candidatus Gottesmanbacteria bacterium RIFCSPHIGHO2_01_FULL_47_48]|uniref:Uncharacterized protein n=1 Tax=Candidatus Gottesmanbacteria bacterium RIFCSPHIGHO2_01_FULL_47_48 TaxID=1798381 RepID=A0A1F6A3A1_9BACT|nr:MAG: hypothetical protein A2721_01925 [Candidatus Gottesmanbacteria bacterium RIFCSPHIGHO2_01_FULL_47_48]